MRGCDAVVSPIMICQLLACQFGTNDKLLYRYRQQR
jgi:hypothetical protein